MKILNLYAGIGGNRKLWSDIHEVVSVELNEDIAAIYKSLYPNDKLIVADAHEYLLNHYKEFDFIWSSPPCQSHSSFRQNICVRFRGTAPAYPDMKLYQEIIFLKYNCTKKWVVENVAPYYMPLLEPQIKLQRHLFWSNFKIKDADFDGDLIRTAQIPQLQESCGINLQGFKVKNKRQVLRNCVLPQLGNHILNSCLESGEQK
jgi:DNA (cytosine-5)-methyltransferase 1